MDEKVRIVLEIQDKVTAKLRAIEANLDRVVGGGKGASSRSARAQIDKSLNRELEQQQKLESQLYEARRKAETQLVTRGRQSAQTSRQMEKSLGPMRQSAKATNDAAQAHSRLRTNIEQVGAASKGTGFRGAVTVMEELGGWAGVAAAGIGGVISNLNGFSSAIRQIKGSQLFGGQQPMIAGGQVAGSAEEHNIVTKSLLALGAALGVVSKKSRGTSAGLDDTARSSSGLFRTMSKLGKAMTIVAVTRFGLMTRRVVKAESAMKQFGSEMNMTATKPQRALSSALTRTMQTLLGYEKQTVAATDGTKASAVAYEFLSKSFVSIKKVMGHTAVAAAKFSTAVGLGAKDASKVAGEMSVSFHHMGIAWKTFAQTTRAAGVAFDTFGSTVNAFFRLFKGTGGNPLSIFMNALKGIPGGISNVNRIIATTFRAFGSLLATGEGVKHMFKGLQWQFKAFGAAAVGSAKFLQRSMSGLGGLIRGVKEESVKMFSAFRAGFSKGMAAKRATKAFRESEKAILATNAAVKKTSKSFLGLSTAGSGFGGLQGLWERVAGKNADKALVNLNTLGERFKGLQTWGQGFAADVQSKMNPAMESVGAAAKSSGSSFLGWKTRLAAAAAGALAAVGVFKLLGAAFTTGREHFKIIEVAELQFKFLLQSSEDARLEMDKLRKYAKTTPFTLPGVVQANRLLLNFGGRALATQENLGLIGDAAAVSGQQFERVAFWIGRAYTLLQGNGPIGEATRALTEMGVITGKVQNSLNTMATSGASAEKTWGKLTEAISKNKGATKALSQTLVGLESTMKDAKDEALASVYESWDFFGRRIIKVKIKIYDLLDAYTRWRNEFDKGLDTSVFGSLEERIGKLKDRIQEADEVLKDLDGASWIKRLFGETRDAKYIDALREALDDLEMQLGDLGDSANEAGEALEQMGAQLGEADAIDALRTKLLNLPTVKVRQDFIDLLSAWQGLSAAEKASNMDRFADELKKAADNGIELTDALQTIVDREKSLEEANKRAEESFKRAEDARKKDLEISRMRIRTEQDLLDVLEQQANAVVRMQQSRLIGPDIPSSPLPSWLQGAGEGINRGSEANARYALRSAENFKKVREEAEGADAAIKDVVSMVQIFGRVGDDQTQRVVQAMAGVTTAARSIQTSWKAMADGIKAAELTSVILAVLQVILSLWNAFKGLGKTSERLTGILADVSTSLGDVRSGALTAAEAIDRIKWGGNQEGYEFLRQVVADFEAVGRTVMEAEATVGAFWQAMRSGDAGAMSRIGAYLVRIAEAARAVQRLIAIEARLIDIRERRATIALDSREKDVRARMKTALDALDEGGGGGGGGDGGKKALDKRLKLLRKEKGAALDILKAQAKARKKAHELELEALDDRMELLEEFNDAEMESFDDRMESLKDEKDAYRDAFDDRMELLKDEKDAYVEAFSDRMESLKDEKDARLEAFSDRMESLKDEKDARLEAFSDRMESLKDEKDARLEAFNAEKDRIEGQRKVYQDSHDTRVEQIKSEADIRLKAIDEETNALNAQLVTAEGVWEAAKAFGIRDRAELGGGYQEQAASEKMLNWADQIKKLQLSGTSDTDLSENEVVQSRMKRMVEDIEKYGLALPEHLQALAMLLGYENVEIGTGLSELRGKIEALGKTREQVEAELHGTLESLAADREAVESAFDASIEALMGQREAVETLFDQKIEALEDQREAVEDAFDAKVEALEDQREAVEDAFDAKVEALEDQREAVEDAFDAKVEALEDQREAVEDAFDAKVEHLKDVRERVEKAFDANIASLKMQRDAIESAFALSVETASLRREAVELSFDEKIAALQDIRDAAEEAFSGGVSSSKDARKAIEDEFNAELEAIEAERKIIEDARIARELEGLRLEEERLIVERQLLQALIRLVDGIANVEIPSIRQPKDPGQYGEGRPYASGSGGIRDFGAGTPAMLHRREAVVSEDKWLEAIERAARGSGGGGGGELHVVDFKVGGVAFGRAVLKYQPKAAHLVGVR